MPFLVVIALLVLVPAFIAATHINWYNEVERRAPLVKPREVYRWKEVRRRYPESGVQRRRLTHA